MDAQQSSISGGGLVDKSPVKARGGARQRRTLRVEFRQSEEECGATSEGASFYKV
jgi:hypothetical protein